MGRILFLGLMGVLRYLPLRLLRGIGWLLGQMLYTLVRSRRNVVLTNLRWCFPQLTEQERQRLARQHVVFFIQAVLDRSWLWGRDISCLRKRLRIEGDLSLLQSKQALVLFVPHFVGLDACGTALSAFLQLPIVSIYLPQSKPWMNAWMQKGRGRFGVVTYSRYESPRKIAQAVRQGKRLFLLPDMDFGRTTESLFIPFFEHSTATVPSLSRFARIGNAQVLTVTTNLTPSGYSVRVHPLPWKNFPSQDETADVVRMNRELESLIRANPAQYFWVHKRFKTRPAGEENPY